MSLASSLPPLLMVLVNNGHLRWGGGDENENYVNPKNSVSTSPLTNNGWLGLGGEIIFARDNLGSVPCATGMCQISHQKGW